MFDQMDEAIGRPKYWTTASGVFLEAVALVFLLAAPLLTIPQLPAAPQRQEPLALSINLALPPAQSRAIPSLPTAAPKLFARQFVPPTTTVVEGPRITSEAPPEFSGFGPAPPALVDLPRIELRAAPPVVPRAEPRTVVAPVPKGPVTVGGQVQEANLLVRALPSYPPIARAARIQGQVVLGAVIGKDGRVRELDLRQGPPMLVRAAMDAVSKWIYRPTLLNGEPVEVATTITVNFVLGGTQ